MSATPNLSLPYIDAGQAQKHVTHNEALRSLDALVQLAVLDRDLSTPPGTPAEGQRWIVKPTATDAWAGHENHVAAWQDGAWQFSAAVTGWVAYVIDEEILVAWDGTVWNAVSAGEGGGGGEITELQNLSLLGIGATADSTNPLSAVLNNVLWSAKTVAEGGDGTLRYVLSKESAAKTLSFLFQDNFVGCAEIGLTGDDDFHFKVSPDGTAWFEAITIDRETGKVSFPVSGGPRETLTANRTYYVRTDGSNSNSGLANTSGGAFATLQKAYDTIVRLDLGGFTATIQIADGTYTSGLDVAVSPLGGIVTIAGNTGTPGNVLISTTSARALAFRAPINVTISGLKLQTATSGDALYLEGAATNVTMGAGMQFGSCAACQIDVNRNALLIPSANYTVNGSAGQHIRVQQGGAISGSSVTVTLAGTPAFSSFFASAEATGILTLFGWTFSGSATGQRYTANLNGVINTFGGGANFLPGSVSGTTSTGGQYQ